MLVALTRPAPTGIPPRAASTSTDPETWAGQLVPSARQVPAGFLPAVVSDPGGPETMDGEGGVPTVAPCPLAEAQRRLAVAVARRSLAIEAAQAHSELVGDAYAALDLARRWGLPAAVVDEGWATVGGLEEDSTPIWARAHMAYWVRDWARTDVARVQEALGMPVDDIDRLDDERRDAYIASLTDEQRVALAGPWPVEWLYSPKSGDPIRIVNLFAGPGGWCEGITTVLGESVDMVGVDISEGACATARAAGHRRICVSVTELDPEHSALRYVVAVILSPPCQTLSPGGKRAGLEASAMQILEDVITDAGLAAGFIMVDDAGDGMEGYAPPTGATWAEVRAPLAGLEDPRTGLMAEVVIWPLALQAKHGNVRWVAMEQSSNLLKSPAAQYVVEAITTEFYGAGWEYSSFSLIEAADYGAASKRRRSFLVCMRYTRPFVDFRPKSPFPATTWAQCMGWEKGHKVNTRGVRGIDPNTGRPKGGGTFSADRPGTTVTGTAYGWKREADGLKHSHAALGRAVGFRASYPWTHVGRGEGIRAITQQVADPVCPMVAAAWIAHIMGRQWEPQTRSYVLGLYPLAEPGGQADGATEGLSVSVQSAGDERSAPLQRHGAGARREGRVLTHTRVAASRRRIPAGTRALPRQRSRRRWR